MKNVRIPLVLIIMTMIILSSCSKDDDNLATPDPIIEVNFITDQATVLEPLEKQLQVNIPITLSSVPKDFSQKRGATIVTLAITEKNARQDFDYIIFEEENNQVKIELLPGHQAANLIVILRDDTFVEPNEFLNFEIISITTDTDDVFEIGDKNTFTLNIDDTKPVEDPTFGTGINTISDEDSENEGATSNDDVKPNEGRTSNENEGILDNNGQMNWK